MNLNVKLEGEEEQTLQYVNRFAINIPSGATTFNLNIVNPGLSNQSYILNPVNPVGQNIVAYQQPMAVQSYIALPTEGEGNIIHSLPVGVPVPVGLPVPTGLLQNHNIMNTSIIIGNEDCNSPGVLKSSNNLNPGNEVEINYIEKPVEEISNNGISPIEIQNVELNHTPQVNSEGVIKKLCPLEMSIKAANIDMEFDKCEAEVQIVQDNRTPHITPQFNMPSGNHTKITEVPLEVTPVQNPIIKVEDNDSAIEQLKTEITWDDDNVKSEIVSNDFQESLICEVEEVNDEDEDDEVEEESGGKSETKSNHDQYSGSSGESDALPLSVALKLKKLPKKKISEQKKNKKVLEKDKVKRKRSHKHKKQKGQDEEEEWSESDDDVLNTKRVRNEYNYKCVYEPESTKSETVLVLKIDEKSEKFTRVRICCTKKECGKKISVKDQKTAFKNFYDLESNLKRDAYLMNCIEHVQKSRHLEKENAKDKTQKTGTPDDKKLLVNANIQLEIENESNGNQKLSDEIQNAIQESLKDCLENETREESNKSEAEVVETGEKVEKNSWNFYLVIDRCRKRVCLQFLLKLFHITKNRIKQLQKKVLSGTPLVEDSTKPTQKSSEIWEMAKLHIGDLVEEECLDCNANPRHRFLSQSRTREDLFVNFKEYCIRKIGKEPTIKYKTYKRFLDKETNLSFTPKQEGACAECEHLKKHPKRKQKTTKSKGKKSKGDSEGSSDDEPLMKRKKLKLTIPLKVVNKQNSGKRCSKNPLEKKKKGKSKEKTKQSMSKGRDVWSLMLLHLETMPYKECNSCVSKKKHRFLNPTFTTQGLFEDYRKYFLKETNSELGLGFTMYEKYFIRNCNYTISDVDVNAAACPRCAIDGSKS